MCFLFIAVFSVFCFYRTKMHQDEYIRLTLEELIASTVVRFVNLTHGHVFTYPKKKWNFIRQISMRHYFLIWTKSSQLH